MDEKFNQVELLKSSDGDTLAEIELSHEYPKKIGLLWLNGGWITIEKARELRDWLNKVIP